MLTVVLQADLDSLQSWSDTWQLKFNADKCKVMHIGHSFQTKYMGENSARKELESVHQERHLRVIITSDLKSSSQCLKSVATARKVIAMVRRTFRNLVIADFKLIYKTYQTTYGILQHPSLVTTFCQRYRRLGKSSKSGNKSGINVAEV